MRVNYGNTLTIFLFQESIISNLSEDILARDDKIAVLENHINQIEDEVRMLQSSLAEMVDTGEQITDYGSQKINQSIKSMEAHRKNKLNT